MKKILLIVSLVYSNLTYAFPPVGAIGQSQTSTLYPTVNKAPYSQVTNLGAGQVLLETGNGNMFANGEFEAVATSTPPSWTCTTGTCTKTTTAGEFSSGKAAMKIVPAANVIDVSQSVSTTSGIQKQGFARVIYKVPSTCSTFQVLTTVDSATQTTVPTANLVYDDTFRSIEVPLTYGSTNAGIKFTASTTCTGNIFVDGVILNQGIGFQNLQGDTEYSAQANISAVVSQLNKPSWIGNGSIVGAIYTYPITGFTVAPNCWAVNTTHGAGSGRLLNTQSTATTVAVEVTNTSGATASTTMSIGCQKSGNDYLASSSNVYSQASANTNMASYTPTIAGTTASSVDVKWERRGDMLKVIGTFAHNGGGAITMTLPMGLTIDSAKISSSNYQTVGEGSITTAWYYLTVLAQGGLSTVTFGLSGTGTSGNNPFTGWSTERMQFNFEVPISGWTNTSPIVGSFASVGPQLSTAVASTSGTSIDFTIPLNAKRIIVMLAGVSTNGTSDIVVRLGSGSVLSSGYVGSTGVIRAGGSSNVYAFSTGFNINIETLAADNFSGISTFNLMGSNVWTNSGSIGSNTASRTSVSGAYVPLGGVLDRLRITTANGTDAFDAGTVNVSWEY